MTAMTAIVIGMQTCAIEGCGRKVRSRGWCNAHYLRWYFHGDPNAKYNQRDEPPADRFATKLRPTATGCIEWTGTVTPKGYGLFYDGTKMVAAHRWAYQQTISPIPDGLQIDHLCRNRRCVNVAHLEVVTAKENQARSPFDPERRTHCPSGHEYTDANTYRRPGTNSRACRACHKRRNEVYQAKLRSGRR